MLTRLAWCAPNVGFGGNVLLVAMPCSCGTPSCRGVIDGRDWRSPELQERYRGWFSWYLQRKIDVAGS